MEVLVERLHADVELPSRATSGSAGYDVRAYLMERTIRVSDGAGQTDRPATRSDAGWSVELDANETALIPLGFRARLPHGMEAQVRPRSGLAFKHSLTVPNAPGTIDSDYAEEWMVMIRNDGPVPHRISHGERIAQVIFARYETPAMREGAVARSSERSGGFGSTGRS